MREGEWVDAKKIQENVFKGIKDIYGTQGYIQADVNFIPEFKDRTDTEGDVTITLEVEEGRQFSLRRLEFIGNTNTRDAVLRREVVLNEGDPYNKRYWDLSILRLNQFGLLMRSRTRTRSRAPTTVIRRSISTFRSRRKAGSRFSSTAEFWIRGSFFWS
ncbi:MAG: hypothetical protein IPJ07_23510 [Acidobacteria bacterium]|nr:hypothetical protein [Acidobacteriota bacterium]